ncbi:MAG: agmatine deiminase family protein, partial [Planctomycetota bacterium]
MANRTTNANWRMPDEAARHECTWMAFGADEEIWDDLTSGVQRSLANIANSIAKFEPVKMLARSSDMRLASRLCSQKVKLVEADLDDIWIRDTGPTFVVKNTDSEIELGAVDLNFNGWGNKQAHDRDATVAGFVADQARATYLASDIVGEGGGLEVDGEGTAIITESCFVNDNRNPAMKREDIENELRYLLGLHKIIWLPGIRNNDITDGHTDFYARFARPGVVVAGLEMDRDSFDYDVTREHLEILKTTTDGKGRRLKVVTLESPRRIREDWRTGDFAAGYINFYVVNGAVIAPQFGDRKADNRCLQSLTELFPKRKIIQLNIDAIA